MNYAIILAGGIGSRLKSTKQPKQYLKLDDKTVLEHAILKFCLPKYINRILVVVNRNHEKQILKTIKSINKTVPDFKDRLHWCLGGTNRNHSLANGIKWLHKNLNLQDDDIVISHDAARPFVTQNEIIQNIRCCKKYKACTTVIDCTDTISKASQNFITQNLVRSELKNQQTPQSFIGKIAKQVYIKDDNIFVKDKTTDACGFLLKNNIKIWYIHGSKSNFKITDDFDLELARFLISKHNKKT